MLLVQGQAYRQQYGLNAITLLPVNLYGPRDNFDLESSHVIPALIRKVIEARDNGADHVQAWGTGSVSREFLFVRDAAEAIVLATELYNKPDPVNIGSGQEITIRVCRCSVTCPVGRSVSGVLAGCTVRRGPGPWRWSRSQMRIWSANLSAASAAFGPWA